MIKIGVVGYGYWGPNLVRNFTEALGSKVAAISDVKPERLAIAKHLYPSVKATPDYRELLNDKGIDAVAIATSVSTHYELAMKSLEAGKHVLIEKPLAATTGEARQLIDEADKRKLVLMVDHTFIYTGAVRKIREIVQSGDMGDIYYYDSVRVNLGLFQHDANVIWDLAVHDVSIMDYVLPLKPYAVSATGTSHIADQPENIAYITLFFENRLIGHVNVNWLSPVKVRRTLIGGSQKMIVFDDLEPSEKVKVYDKGIKVKDTTKNNVYEIIIKYRTGDMWAPHLDTTEALRAETVHFIDCVERGEHPISDGESGFRVVRILEAATLSMQERGRCVNLDAARAKR